MYSQYVRTTRIMLCERLCIALQQPFCPIGISPQYEVSEYHGAVAAAGDSRIDAATRPYIGLPHHRTYWRRIIWASVQGQKEVLCAGDLLMPSAWLAHM